jgi:DAK2 domain fusion protein YloV
VQDTSDMLGVHPLLRFSALALSALAQTRDEIDALNVYPVPDGDTGTNLFLTFESGHEALGESVASQGGPEAAESSATVAAYARGLLLGARGNSGVIVSEMVGALLRRLAAAAPGESLGVALAAGMEAAADAAYVAVARPVEGTMLTVARYAARRATRVASVPGVRAGVVLDAACGAAEEALARTPEQLAVLRRAGVVDAGGRGLCVLLDAARDAVTRARDEASIEVGRWTRPPLTVPSVPPPALTVEEDLTEDGPAYEVTYLLDAEEGAVTALRARLDALGDSLVVVGGEHLWNVHVHVDDVGAAIEAGIAAGRPHRIRVTHFAEQVARARARAEGEQARRGPGIGRAVVALAVGSGTADLFAKAGAVVVRSGFDRRPSTGELLDAVRGTGAAEVVILPNDPDAVAAAEAAAGLARTEHGSVVAVIPTVAQVQGIAALAVHDPARPLGDDLVQMASAARHARSGAVTVAVRRAMTSGGECRPGDVLGAVEGDFVVVGHDVVEVGLEVVSRMLRGGGELVTVIAGEGGEELARRCARHVEEHFPLVEVVLHDGGQERYLMLVGVE